MNRLELRKQLLVAESELNRAQLAANLITLKTGVRALTARAKSVSAIASTVALLVTMLMAFRRAKNSPDKPSWLRLILKGVDLVTAFWPGRRPPSPEPAEVE